MAEDNEADIALLLDPSIHFGEDNCPWQEVIDRWTPSMKESESDPASLDLFLVRLLADGLWVHHTLTHTPMSKQQRQQLMNRIQSLLELAAEQ